MRTSRLTPQQKKKLSLERDHYNTYGESDKAARRIVPLRATKGRRAVRHLAKVSIGKALLQEDVDTENKAEAKALSKEKTRWKKLPSPCLKDLIQHSQKKRWARSGRKKAAQTRNAA